MKDPISPKDYNIQRSPLLYIKRLRKKIPTVSEKISIAYKAIVGLEMYADIAKEFRISSKSVGIIVKKAQSNERFVDELIEERETGLAKKRTIKLVVEEMI